MSKPTATVRIERSRSRPDTDPVWQVMAACDAFLQGIVALREINVQIENLSEERSDKFDFSELVSHLTQVQHSEFSEILGRIIEVLQEAQSRNKDAPGDTPLPLVKEFTTNDRAVADILVRTILEPIRTIGRPKRRPIIRKSLLSVSLSDYELLLGTAAEFAMLTHPSSANIGEAKLTLSELQSFNSLQDGIQHVIERCVESFLRSDASGWEKWFAKFGLIYKDTVVDWPGYTEMVARRNILVHNGGYVNDQYLRVTKASDLSLGTKLDVDAGYLDECLERVSSMGLLLIYSVLIKLAPENADRVTDWATNLIEMLLEEKQLKAAAQCSATILEKTGARLSRSRELHLKASYWTAQKELGHVDDVRREVGAWDTSGLDSYYRLVQAALLGKTDEAQLLLDEQLRQHKLSPVSASVNPLFAGLRLQLEATGSTEPFDGGSQTVDEARDMSPETTDPQV